MTKPSPLAFAPQFQPSIREMQCAKMAEANDMEPDEFPHNGCWGCEFFKNCAVLLKTRVALRRDYESLGAYALAVDLEIYGGRN